MTLEHDPYRLARVSTEARPVQPGAMRWALVFAGVLGLALADPAAADAKPATKTLQAVSGYTRLHCPARRFDDMKAADLAQAEDGFSRSLPQNTQVRLTRAIARDRWGAPLECRRYNGLVCPANAELNAIAKAGLVASFSEWICRGSGR